MEQLDTSVYFDTLPSVLKKYKAQSRQNAFTGKTKQDFLHWQQATRNHLWQLLGMEYMEYSPANAQEIDVETLPSGILRRHLRIQVEPHVWMPMYILVPPNANQNTRIFICPPGHGSAGKYAIAGCRENPAVAAAIDKYNCDYGLQLAKAGFVAVCPDCRGFGERREAAKWGNAPEQVLAASCVNLANMAQPLGMTVTGMWVWDILRLLDYLQEQNQWNTQKICCAGFSGGGLQTMWAAALDDRIDTAVISGYLYGYADSLLVRNHNCACNYVPHLWRYYDMGDIASLIAPRGLVVQSCKEDIHNGPRGLENVYEQLTPVQQAYQLFNAPNRLQHQVCAGGHHWHSQEILDYIQKVF